MPDLGPVVDNSDEQQFQLVVDGLTAFAAYQRDGNVITFKHTEVPPELQGKGVGGALAHGALDAARTEGAEVVPLCPFIASYIRRHRDFLDLVTDRNRKRLKLDRPS
jgi:predicted GNAT family acetyltransferase